LVSGIVDQSRTKDVLTAIKIMAEISRHTQDKTFMIQNTQNNVHAYLLPSEYTNILRL